MNSKKTSVRSNLAGALITIAASILFIGLFWGFGWLTHWDTRFFSTGSDDLIKDIYTTTFHVAYDEGMTMSHAMNYPHGEYYTFTGLQPIVAAPLQWLRDAGVSHPERAVLPLMNLMSLLSIVLCALFLFLLLRDFKLPTWYSIICALLITMMSPQLQRIGGHSSLSYYCAIPMLLYFTLRHIRSGGWGWALANGAAMLFFGLCHPYYIVFYIVIIGGELLYLVIRRKQMPLDGNRNILRIVIAALLQFIIPLCLFYYLSHTGLPDGDRTAVPSGFHYYRGRIEGILFPYGRLYFFEDSHLFADVKWESRCYVGIVSVVAIILILWHFFKSLVKKQYCNALRPTDSRELNLMLLLATALMLYACGVPLSWMPHNIVSYIGPLAQFRAQGRFVWLFYYVINIVALYSLYGTQASSPAKNSQFSIFNSQFSILLLALLLLSAEATAYNWRNKAWYTASWDEWTDYDNHLPQNQWLNNIDATEYQAILSFPVFNAGSEMAYLPSQDRMFHRSALLSMKTSLPLICHESARSDVRQAWDCIAISRTAFQPLAIADQLPNNKPLLLAVTKQRDLLTDAEKLILSHADSLFECYGMDLYHLNCQALRTVHLETLALLCTLYDSIAQVDSVHGSPLRPAKGTVSIQTIKHSNIQSWNTLFDDTISLKGEIEISFWMSDIFKDLYTRTTFKVESLDADGNSTQLHNWSGDANLDLVDRDKEEGLFRIKVTMPDNCNRLKVTARCRESRPAPVTIHHLLIRPANTHLATPDHRLDNIPIKF